MERLIVIGGATATGKTAAAVALCERIGGEVVSCDSMQLYRGMNVGTAKPDEDEKRGVAHHLIDVLDPAEHCSASRYRDMALPIIEDIIRRGHIPVLCGGTGLYIDALTKPMSFSVKSDEHLRAALRAIANEPGGKMRLHDMLAQVDPQSAARLHPNDVLRVTRALEIYRLAGRTQTELMQADRARKGDFKALLFALSWPREALYLRIDARVDQMIARGLFDEVRLLIDNGVPRTATAMQAIGYKEIVRALDGETTPEEAVAQIKRGTRNYAKRQITWFGRDERTIWIDAAEQTPEIISREMEGYIHEGNAT